MQSIERELVNFAGAFLNATSASNLGASEPVGTRSRGRRPVSVRAFDVGAQVGGGQKSFMSEINVTPYVDVMWSLLIISWSPRP
jgi:hypothetical protein